MSWKKAAWGAGNELKQGTGVSGMTDCNQLETKDNEQLQTKKASKQASNQASKQAGRQAGRQASKQQSQYESQNMAYAQTRNSATKNRCAQANIEHNSENVLKTQQNCKCTFRRTPRSVPPG